MGRGERLVSDYISPPLRVGRGERCVSDYIITSTEGGKEARGV